MQEVSEFIVVPPPRYAAVAERARERLQAYLQAQFPHYTFRVLGDGPAQDDDEFSVIPIVNRPPNPGERREKDRLYLCKPLDPRVIPHIRRVLAEFDLLGERVN